MGLLRTGGSLQDRNRNRIKIVEVWDKMVDFGPHIVEKVLQDFELGPLQTFHLDPVDKRSGDLDIHNLQIIAESFHLLTYVTNLRKWRKGN